MWPKVVEWFAVGALGTSALMVGWVTVHYAWNLSPHTYVVWSQWGVSVQGPYWEQMVQRGWWDQGWKKSFDSVVVGRDGRMGVWFGGDWDAPKRLALVGMDGGLRWAKPVAEDVEVAAVPMKDDGAVLAIERQQRKKTQLHLVVHTKDRAWEVMQLEALPWELGESSIAISADDRVLVFTIGSRVHVVDLVQKRELWQEEGSFPNVSADGKWVYFVGWEHREIWRRGEGRRELVTRWRRNLSRDPVLLPMPDGQGLLVGVPQATFLPSAEMMVWKVDLESGDSQRVVVLPRNVNGRGLGVLN